MTLKEKLTAEPGFQYVIDSMELMSAPGRRRMLHQPLLTDPAQLQKEYDHLDRIVAILTNDDCNRHVVDLRHQLMQTHDIQGSLLNLAHHMTLEETELFEIKQFAFICMESLKTATALGINDMLQLPPLDEVFRLLDPDNTGIANFYIYDSYHPDLAELRRQLKAKQTLLDNSRGDAEQNAPLQREINDLFDRQNHIQQEVIARLSTQLVTLQPTLQQALDAMAYTDFLMARATLAVDWHLCRPQLSDDATTFVQLWNPRLRHRNQSLKQRYQPVDIALRPGVCLITGANMAGKTVLLKTVGIAQLLTQFACFVPATSATVRLVDDVCFCIGDEQNEMNGLSSFASEIIKISDTVTRAERQRLLILIDEPARTTNPIEGKAIVQSVATLLDRQPSLTLITTHYSQLGLTCRRLRVKGFVEGMSDQPLTPQNINSFMDYSLLPDESDDVPQEALRIAAILHCNPELIQNAAHFLKKI